MSDEKDKKANVIIGTSSYVETYQTSNSALKNLLLIREYLESLKQALKQEEIIEVRRDHMPLTGIYDEAKSKKSHK